MITYDAELKKYKMKKWHKLAFGSLARTVGGLQYFSAPIHPVQLFHLLHTPAGSAADSQGLSQGHRRDLEDLTRGQADFYENWEGSVF